MYVIEQFLLFKMHIRFSCFSFSVFLPSYCYKIGQNSPNM